MDGRIVKAKIISRLEKNRMYCLSLTISIEHLCTVYQNPNPSSRNRTWNFRSKGQMYYRWAIMNTNREGKLCMWNWSIARIAVPMSPGKWPSFSHSISLVHRFPTVLDPKNYSNCSSFVFWLHEVPDDVYTKEYPLSKYASEIPTRLHQYLKPC